MGKVNPRTLRMKPRVDVLGVIGDYPRDNVSGF